MVSAMICKWDPNTKATPSFSARKPSQLRVTTAAKGQGKVVPTLCLGTGAEALTSPVANYRNPPVPGILRPFHKDSHVVSSVYFETVFAYFVDVTNRTCGVFCGRHLNPAGRENFLQTRQQPVIIVSVQVNAVM